MQNTTKRCVCFNSLSPGQRGFDFKYVISKCVAVITVMSVADAIVFKWMAQNPTDDKSTLVQVMAWCRQAPSHSLSQFWSSYMSPLSHNELIAIDILYAWILSPHFVSSLSFSTLLLRVTTPILYITVGFILRVTLRSTPRVMYNFIHSVTSVSIFYVTWHSLMKAPICHGPSDKACSDPNHCYGVHIL